MRIALPPCDTQRRVIARADRWQWESVIDDSHQFLDIDLPSEIEIQDVEVFAFVCDAHGQRIASRPGIVLKSRKR